MNILITYPFLTPVLVMLAAELTKHLNEGLTAGRWFDHGGMPSSHSAFVTSLLMIVGYRDGLESTTFAIATVFAGIVWYDAAFVRSHVGKQGKVLNVLQQFQKFSERIGHSSAEVAGGIIFGIVATLLLWHIF